MFPTTADEFAALAEQGLTVAYTETASESNVPDGDGWSYWRDRLTPDESVAVWRRIVPIEELP